MEIDRYSLSNLRDIVIPDPPPFWPPAPGVWVALGMVVVLALLVGLRVHQTLKRNAYRKAGLLLLRGARTTYDVSVVMKRVALAVFPREEVASLYGEEWARFLNRTCPRGNFSEMVTTDASTESDPELIDFAGIWIRHHRVSESRTPAAVR